MTKKLYIPLTVAVMLAFSPANAAEFTFATIKPAAPTTEFTTALNAVCTSGTFKLSDRARLACVTGNMPRVVNNGDAFANTGVGAELNTLVRQVAAQ